MGHRRTCAAVLLLAGLALGSWPRAARPAPRTAPPNVLLIIADDQGWTDFGFIAQQVGMFSYSGLSKDQIYYAGFGASHARANKKDSRRVEIVILAQKN